MRESISFYQSKNIHDYKAILAGLQEDFEMEHWPYILTWCGILDNDLEHMGKYWEVWLIEVDEKKVGICGIYSLKRDTTEMWLGWFGVLKPYRRMGIGGVALEFMEIEASKAGCKRLISYISKGTQPLKFYKENGYTEYPIPIFEFEDPNIMYISKKIDLNKSDKSL